MYKDQNLNLLDINIYGLILYLSQTKGYCFVSNTYLSKYYNKTTRSISKSISKLKSENYILIKKELERRIYPIKLIEEKSK